MMDKTQWGVHEAHCCYIHGCKYGDPECPVTNGLTKQKYLCWDCTDLEEEPYTLEEIEELRQTKSYRPTVNELKQRIVELEEENKTFQKHYIEMVKKEVEENYFDLLKDLQLYKEDNAKLKKENAKLQERLEETKPPKFKYHQTVYAVANTDVLKGQIEVFDFYQKKYLVHFYGIDDINCLGDEWCYEKELFATKKEIKRKAKDEKLED